MYDMKVPFRKTYITITQKTINKLHPYMCVLRGRVRCVVYLRAFPS